MVQLGFGVGVVMLWVQYWMLGGAIDDCNQEPGSECFNCSSFPAMPH